MPLYNVIFSGRTVPGYSVDQVKTNLSRAVNSEHFSFKPLFSGRDVIVKKEIDKEAAEKFKQMMNRAGAICRIEPAESPTVLAAAETPSKTVIYDQLPVITPLPGPAQVKYAPITCPELTRFEGGIDINRKDTRHLSFNDIRMVSVFIDLTAPSHQLKFLFFTYHLERPLLVNADKMRFKDFSAVKGASLMDSLRGFLALIVWKHPDVILDVSTRHFLKGARPQAVDKGIDAFSTALGKALAERAPKVKPL